MTTQKIISLVPMLFITLAAFTGVSRFKRLSQATKIIVVAWMLVFLTEAAGHITGYFKIRNLWLYNIFFLLWFLSLSFAFQFALQNKAIRKAINVSYFLLPLLFIANIIFLQGNKNLQSLFFVTGGCFIIFLCMAYLMELYNSEETEKLQSYPFFWFSIGLLFYFSINVLFLGMYNLLISKADAFSRIYHLYISDAIIILLNLSVWKGFLCRKISPK